MPTHVVILERRYRIHKGTRSDTDIGDYFVCLVDHTLTRLAMAPML